MPVCWDVAMHCWGIALLWKPHHCHSHYVFMFVAAVPVCCSEARDSHNVIAWNNGASLPDCTLLVYPHLYLPLCHHSPLQPLTTSTMLCHWFLSCALFFQLLIPRICSCCSVTSDLLTEGLCLFLVHSGFIKVSFQRGFKLSDLESCRPTFVMSGSLYSTHSPLLYSTHSTYSTHTQPPVIPNTPY